jgi:hypothetical protein
MDRTTVAFLGLMAWLVCGSAGATLAPVPQDLQQGPARTEKGLYLLEVVAPGYDITIRETERGPAHSLIEIEMTVSAPTVMAGIAVLLKAVYDIAKERSFGFTFANPQASDSSTRPGGQHVASLVKVVMTNNPDTPLRELLGADYSPEAQQQFDRKGWLPVTQLALMFREGETPGDRVGDPLSDLIGVYSFTPGGEPAFGVSKDGQDYFFEGRMAAARSTPIRLVARTESERAEAAAKGLTFSAGLRMNQGSADQGFDILRIEEVIPGSGGTVVFYVLFSWFGPDLVYKVP